MSPLLQRRSHRRGFTVFEFLLYTIGLLLLVQAVCVATRLTVQVVQQLPPYVDLVRMHLPAVRQLCRDAGKKEVVYALEKECLYRRPDGGRRICIAREVAAVEGRGRGILIYTTTSGWRIEEDLYAPR